MPSSYAPRRLDCSGWSRTGAVRKSNADQFLIADLAAPFDAVRHDAGQTSPAHLRGFSWGQLLLVADGIGSGSGGVLASRLVVDELQGHLNAGTGRREDDATTLARLVALLKRAQLRMRAAVRGDDQRPIGTTVTAAFLLGNTLHVLHAGDSRCYLLRDGKLRRLTTDHNLAQRLVDERFMSAASARNSSLRHVLWNAVTSDCRDFTVDSAARQIRHGDLLLLCTDGLTKHLTDADILAVSDRNLPAAEITQQLVDAALAAGGQDNITVVVARYLEQPAMPVPSPGGLEADENERDDPIESSTASPSDP